MGLSQGNPLAPLAFNLFVHEILDSQYSQDLSNPPLHRYSDNLDIPCKSAPESRRARARLEELLTPHGFKLKTEAIEGEKTHADLRAGETTRLLGFVLSYHEGTLDFDVGPDRWARLESNLEECHTIDAGNPHEMAVQTLRGWITSAAPAFTSRRLDSTVSRIMELIGEYGFREIRAKTILTDAKYAHCQWVNSLSATPNGAHDASDAWATAARNRSFT
jgi:hypothetical protein